ncbi:putative disease resistance RPP13-like protein 1 [Cornus florida]|uniref:putative disease resistance RPP13-like protein 1 n=1 Tax=Cornus florida TaxID=4283 RepID=UPI00289DBD10|nr:putative disease resistance RPP13-like protein 1 [Cornus florida]
MVSKIENVIEKLEYIAKQKDVLGLKNDGEGKFGVSQRTPTTPHLIESHVYGRDGDKEEIIKLLLADDEMDNTDPFCVIPILGMGGIGKTTLAQTVYNDKRMDECFDVKAWACVSDDFNVMNVTKALLESATNKPCDTMNLELLQSSLKDKLSKKKFLIVLDDVWNENYDNWHVLLLPFMVGAKRSKIIVTTRNEEVLSVTNTLPPYCLKEMSDNACWLLFLHHAFGNRKPDVFPSLKPIGRQIVNKCKGLPLAAKTLGGLLGSKLDTDYWYKILNSNLWDLPPKKNAILPALRLSYHHLPTNLKRCFAYCSIFPKDYEFDRKSLVLLWMAEGFVQQIEKVKRMEEVADGYFAELLSRSLFQESTQSKARYVMHDLINDLAQFVSRKMCMRLEDKEEKNKQHEIFEKGHHFSYIRTKYDVFKKFESLYEVRRLRTFLPLASSLGGEFCYLTKKVVHDLLPKSSFLRVLSLSGYCINELPDSIGNLKHLRYLDLSHTEINSLPRSVSTLYNLQTLLLCECIHLTELPMDMGNLINLRHLDISGSGIREMPLQIDNLRSLHTLPEFIVGSDSGSGIGKLRNLVHLQGRLSISRLENVANAWEARRANLKDKQDLNELMVEWSNNFDELRNESVEMDVLEMLQPHQKLEKITVKCYRGTRFASWLGNPSFYKLVSLSFVDCERCMFLPPLGQLPSLKKLLIKGMNGVKSVGPEFYGYGLSSVRPFPSLELLCFEEMPEWEDWSSFGGENFEGFPSLRELYIERCPKLQRELPNHLPSLTKLVIHESEQLTSSLPRLPLLHELELKECDKAFLGAALDLTSLASLDINFIPNLTYLPAGLIQWLARLERLVIVDCFDLMYLAQNEVGLQHLTSLQHLVIRNCPLLVSLFEGEQQLPGKLEYLELDCCHMLEKLPFGLHILTSLRELTIKDCPRLASFPQTNFPSNLRGLAIRRCDLESLPEMVVNDRSASLECLYISGCYNLTSFPRGGVEPILPTTFKELTIEYCPNLESLPEGIMHSNNMSLEVLEIFDCSSIMSFPKGQLPTTLKTLAISNCSKLESLADVMMQTISLESLRIVKCTNLKFLPSSLHNLAHLDYFEIDGCPGLVSFPQGGLPTTSLKKVNIINCENLKSLPERMQYVTSLQELQLSDCPSIISFPEGGLPINLISLEIKDCKNLTPLSEWGLHRLTSLKRMIVYGENSDLASFPEWLLPSTLSTFHIERLSSLDSLTWLQNLTSLEELKIKDCNSLQSLPEWLPSTLSYLEISHCPLLEQHCETNWAKIDHIPCIVM